MDSKVILYDENNVKVGKTFRRRANQLVSQQRAEWTDENQGGIRFTSSGEALAVALDDEPETTGLAKPDGSRIYALAKKRLRERKLFVWHSAALVPVFLLSSLILEQIFFPVRRNIGPYNLLMGLTCGAWGMSYAIHAWYFIKTYGRGIRRRNREERHAQKIEAEVYRLKNMGLSDKL
ncbi:MAG: hypothetical protein FWE91_07770 [Defluviitaleaceae bacterium]|nr:hypothetical protein [Defluviitaleaceae bacterium]MCL2836869.1 hypothetical protein [Defluviitaleaceae bacterium]